MAQAAGLIEENPNDPQQPKANRGRVVWRLDTVNTGQGQPLDTVVRATVEIPDGGMWLDLTIQRNRDATLPSSHIMELVFRTTGEGRGVADINVPLMRFTDEARGVPLRGLAVPVRENRFLIGLNSLPADVERNTESMTKRNLFELPMKLTSGIRGTLIFEKGATGDRVISDAFRQWSAGQ